MTPLVYTLDEVAAVWARGGFNVWLRAKGQLASDKSRTSRAFSEVLGRFSPRKFRQQGVLGQREQSIERGSANRT